MDRRGKWRSSMETRASPAHNGALPECHFDCDFLAENCQKLTVKADAQKLSFATVAFSANLVSR
jgi:hypothetical protein